VHAEEVRARRAAERDARAEYTAALLDDPDFVPLEGGMLALLLSGEESGAVTDAGGDVARLHAAALAKATATAAAAPPVLRGAPPPPSWAARQAPSAQAMSTPAERMRNN
jgi:hypothetical protein